MSASRGLQRMRLADAHLDRLKAKGFLTCKDVLSRTRIELVNALDLDLEAVDDILGKVSAACRCAAPSFCGSQWSRVAFNRRPGPPAWLAG